MGNHKPHLSLSNNLCQTLQYGFFQGGSKRTTNSSSTSSPSRKTRASIPRQQLTKPILARRLLKTCRLKRAPRRTAKSDRLSSTNRPVVCSSWMMSWDMAMKHLGYDLHDDWIRRE